MVRGDGAGYIIILSLMAFAFLVGFALGVLYT